ncbi:MAG: hypothetical protein AB7U18_25825, partial [Dehalococcoidia bacterium]
SSDLFPLRMCDLRTQLIDFSHNSYSSPIRFPPDCPYHAYGGRARRSTKRDMSRPAADGRDHQMRVQIREKESHVFLSIAFQINEQENEADSDQEIDGGGGGSEVNGNDQTAVQVQGNESNVTIAPAIVVIIG